jgi:hypothetical protein
MNKGIMRKPRSQLAKTSTVWKSEIEGRCYKEPAIYRLQVWPIPDKERDTEGSPMLLSTEERGPGWEFSHGTQSKFLARKGMASPFNMNVPCNIMAAVWSCRWVSRCGQYGAHIRDIWYFIARGSHELGFHYSRIDFGSGSIPVVKFSDSE